MPKNRFEVEINGQSYNLPTIKGGTCSKGENVKVVVSNGNWNQAFILTTASSGSSDNVDIEHAIAAADAAAQGAINAKSQVLSTLPSVNTAIQEAENVTAEAREEIENIKNVITKNPQIGSDDHWYIWNVDTNQYEKTDSLAIGNTMFATFDIDISTGNLIMNTTKEYKGANFSIENNRLVVII